MVNIESFLREIDNEILKIIKRNVTERLLRNGEGSINDVIIAMKEEDYNETEIAESLMHV